MAASRRPTSRPARRTSRTPLTRIADLADLATTPGGLDNVTDIDPGNATGIAVVAANANLICSYSLDGGTNWTALGSPTATNVRLLAADNDNRLYCRAGPDLNGTFAAALTFRAWDQSSGADGGSANTTSNGGVSAFSTATDTIQQIVNAVNDAPTATNLSAAETYFDGQSLDLQDIVAADVDNSTLTASLTLSNPAAGTLTTASAGAATSTYNPSTGVWTASGPIANLNTLLAGVRFTPASGFTGGFTMATNVSDGIAPPTAGTNAMTHGVVAITVASPNGGESWAAGSTQSITWSGTAPAGAKVTIDLYKGAKLVKTIVKNLAFPASGQGSYPWPIPGSTTAGSDYTIRISIQSTAIADATDHAFTITNKK